LLIRYASYQRNRDRRIPRAPYTANGSARANVRFTYEAAAVSGSGSDRTHRFVWIVVHGTRARTRGLATRSPSQDETRARTVAPTDAEVEAIAARIVRKGTRLLARLDADEAGLDRSARRSTFPKRRSIAPVPERRCSQHAAVPARKGLNAVKWARSSQPAAPRHEPSSRSSSIASPCTRRWR
jgi:hypothetical protein